jgi:hypothetical protein
MYVGGYEQVICKYDITFYKGLEHLEVLISSWGLKAILADTKDNCFPRVESG